MNIVAHIKSTPTMSRGILLLLVQQLTVSSRTVYDKRACDSSAPSQALTYFMGKLLWNMN